jgi:hypothetical protein
MRQAQNSKRVRGRGGRKVVNQMSRTMDSNGPDVKVRGTASHIYDKYQTLARDANSSGDRIAAENYLQHAEHYFRLINAMQAQSNSAPAQPQTNTRNVNGSRNDTVADAPQPVEDSPQPIVEASPKQSDAASDTETQPAEVAADNAPPQRGRVQGRNPRGRRRAPAGEGKAASPRKSAGADSEPQLALADQDKSVSESVA